MILKIWIEEHFYYFTKDEALIAALSELISQIGEKDPGAAANLSEVLTRQQAKHKPPHPSLIEAVVTVLRIF
jgi:hypothetical protein